MRRLVTACAAAVLLTGCAARAAAPTPPATTAATSPATTALSGEDAYLAALHAMGAPAQTNPQALAFGRSVCDIKDTGFGDEATLRAVDTWREEDVHLPNGRTLSAHTMAQLALGTLCPGRAVPTKYRERPLHRSEGYLLFRLTLDH